jgi:hypothetical protein
MFVAGCDTDLMHRLSSNQVAHLEQIWAELTTSYPAAGPPETDVEVAAVALDAWIAGVVSSNGTLTSAAVRDLVDLFDEVDLFEVPGKRRPVTDLVRRTLALVSPST